MGDDFQSVRLTSPGWLVALLLVPLVVMAVRGSMVREPAGRRVVGLMLRGAGLGLLVLALCCPVAERARNVSLDFVPADRSGNVGVAHAGKDVWIETVEAPSEVRPGDPVRLEVVIGTTLACSGTIRVTCDGKEVAKKDVEIPDGRYPVPLELELAAGPRDVYRIAVEAEGDTREGNNWGEVAVWHGARARSLLVGPDTSRFSQLARHLEQQRFDVEIVSADALPADLQGFSSYDLVVLADVPATALTAGQLEAIERYVHDHAGGLVVFGGPEGLTAGGYRQTALENVLPVTCEYDAEAKRPSLAMVAVIDQSGSMEEGGAIGLAKTALRQTVEMLDAQDELGVIAFQDTTEWIVPLQPCDDKQKVFREIDTLKAGGGTNMHPAIDKAFLALREAYADRKHILVLTDGLSYPGDFDTLAAEVAGSEITISTVAVGAEAAEPLLQSIAELGGGNYHHCATAAEVPGIFERETAKAAGMGIREEPFFPKAEPALSEIASLSGEKPPALLGYVQTKAKAEARVGMASESGDPLVAWWRFGRGRAAIFASDLHGPWTRPWQNWGGLSQLQSGLMRWAVRPAGIDGYRLAARHQGDWTVVTLDAIPYPGRFENDAEVVLDVVSHDGAKQPMQMPLVAPGQYVAEVATPKAVVYDFEVTCKVGDDTVFAGRCSACPGYAAEWFPRQMKESLLRRSPAATGPFNAFVKEVASGGEPPSVERRGLWQYLVLGVLVLLLVELTIRRLPAWRG